MRERLREREGERDLCDCMNFMILLFVSQGKAVFIAIHLRPHLLPDSDCHHLPEPHLWCDH